jgi:hypothetical protein
VELVRIIGVFGGPEFRITYPNGHMVSYTTTVFEARPIGGTAKADGEEATALRYVSREEAALLPMGPWTRILTEAAFQRREGAVFAAPTWTPGA